MTENIANQTQVVSIHAVQTSFSPLRSKIPLGQTDGLAPMPIRVIRCPNSPEHFEVIDGFKRFRAAREANLEEISVVVDEVIDVKEAKRLILQSNSPRRTISSMDEARVVKSLVDEHGLTLTATSKLLGRKCAWTSKRYTLAKRLDASLQNALDEKLLTVSVAYSLCRFGKKEQVRMAHAIRQGGLSSTNGLALIATYCALDGEDEKKDLLRDPMGTLSDLAVSKKPALPLSETASGKLDRYRKLGALLKEFQDDTVGETVSPAESRLLAAERKFIEAQIISCGHRLSGVVPEGLPTENNRQEDTGYGSRHDSRDLPVMEKRHEEEGHRAETGPECQNHSAHPQKTSRHRGRITSKGVSPGKNGRQAGPLPRHDHREGGEETFRREDSSRNQECGIHRRPDHFNGSSP